MSDRQAAMDVHDGRRSAPSGPAPEERDSSDAVTDASDPRQSIDAHRRTSEPDAHRVQTGWQIYDRRGKHLGKVIERDDESILVSYRSDDHETRFPVKLIADEVTDGRWATLSVADGELGE